MGNAIKRAIGALVQEPLLMRERARRQQGKVPRILNAEDTLRLAYEKRLSLSRFGDGEFAAALGRSIPFQEANASLEKRLRSILKGEGIGDSCCVAIPYALSNLEGLTEDSQQWWLKYCAQHRKEIEALLAPIEYCDAQVTRFYINRSNKSESKRLLDLWKALWDNQRILIAEGMQTRFGVANDLFDNVRSVGRVLCPAINAFSSYELIRNAILVHAEQYDLVLLALGPTATVLACDLSQRGLWAIDSGNMDMEYEWLLRCAKNPIKIDGKFSVEVEGGSEGVAEIDDEAYAAQIVDRIALT